MVARTLGEQLNIPVYGINCEQIVSRSQQSEPTLTLSEALLAIAHDQYQAGIYPQWQDVLPIYEN